MITHERLKEVLHYDPETGIFTWKVSTNRSIVVGSEAGCSMNESGRRYIGIDGKQYYAHRLAWFYVYGVWPDRDVDHKDIDPSNNRIANLRLATEQQNIANQKARNKLGVKGVYHHGPTGKYIAQIKVDGKTRHLGLFTDISEAAAAYRTAADKFFGEFARY